MGNNTSIAPTQIKVPNDFDILTPPENVLIFPLIVGKNNLSIK